MVAPPYPKRHPKRPPPLPSLPAQDFQDDNVIYFADDVKSGILDENYSVAIFANYQAVREGLHRRQLDRRFNPAIQKATSGS